MTNMFANAWLSARMLAGNLRRTHRCTRDRVIRAIEAYEACDFLLDVPGGGVEDLGLELGAKRKAFRSRA